MGERSTIIHINPCLDHQVRYGEALKKGFSRHGIKSEVSNKANTPGDIHVVMGPWFALNHWRHSKTLYLDRAYWGDPKCVSVHWLEGGEKVFTNNPSYRKHPDTKPYKSGDRTIYLADYDDKAGSIKGYSSVRYHPARDIPKRSLAKDIQTHDVAVGRRTTALVDAAIAGLKVKTADVHSPIYPISGKVSYVLRDQWLINLAWHNWSLLEIENGEMWNALSRCHAAN